MIDALGLGPFCALMSSVTWAIGSARYSMLSRSNTAFAVNLGRSLVALPLFILSTFVVAGGWEAGLADFKAVSGHHLSWLGLSMIASYGLGDVIFLASTRMIGVPTALAIASSFPLWTALVGRFSGGEKMASLQLVGMFLAVMGVVLVILFTPKAGGTEGASDRRTRWKGLIFAFLTSFLWAVNAWSVSRGGQGLSAPVGSAIRMVFAMFFCVGFSFLFSRKKPLFLPKKVMLGSLWIFVLEAFGGSYFYMYGMTHSPLAVSATLTSLAPVMSVPISWALGLEGLSFYRTLAICMVVLGISFLLGGGV